MDVALNKLEALADRLLTASAQRSQAEIRAIQAAHQTDIAAFLEAVGARVGVSIPSTARRVSSPEGVVRLEWDHAPTPAVDETPDAS